MSAFYIHKVAAGQCELITLVLWEIKTSSVSMKFASRKQLDQQVLLRYTQRSHKFTGVLGEVNGTFQILSSERNLASLPPSVEAGSLYGKKNSCQQSRGV